MNLKNRIEELTANKDLTVLIPSLNEEVAIRKIIQETKDVLENSDINYCILVSDNGSSDKTLDICKEEKVLINYHDEKGYGSNLISAIKRVNSKYLIFYDADGSYDPKEIKNFFKEITNDNSIGLVTGNRLKNQEINSMPFLHRYLGTPVLSFIIRVFFNIKIYDCNSGMRLLNNSIFKKINFFSKGMEFASEVFVKCSYNNIKVKEIFIKFRKDYRGSKPHLSTWSDGWRHLRYIVSYIPDRYFIFLVGIVFFNYCLIFLLSFFNANQNFPRFHTIFIIFALNQILQTILLGIFSLRIYLNKEENLKSRFVDKIIYLKKNNYIMSFVMINFLLVLIEIILLLFKWYQVKFGDIVEISTVIRIINYSSLASLFLNLDFEIEGKKV
jgi:glycosyltransferase involved in cell wall biosynthesis